MPVRVVSSPFHRLRCVSCSQRVEDVEGPFFDFGSLEDGPVELLQGDPQGKKQHHDDVLVCSSCVGKAALLLPGAADRESDFRIQLHNAVRERDNALRLAAEVSKEVMDRLNAAVPSSDMDPRGQSNVTLPSPATDAPPQLSPANGAIPPDASADIDVEEPELEGMTVRQLRAFARERDVQVPADVTTKSDLVDHLQEQLTAPESE
jgi:hypothetical protein